MKRIMIIFFALAALTFTAQPQQGQGKTKKVDSRNGKQTRVYVHGSGNGGVNHMIPNLSEGQKEEIKKLRIDMTKKATSIKNLLAEKRARLNTLQAEDRADMSAINKTIDEIAALQAQQMKAKANFHVKVRALLNDEQKVAFDSRKPRHSFNFDMGRGMEQMKMRSFRFGDADLGPLEENQNGFEMLNDLDSMLGQHYEFQIED